MRSFVLLAVLAIGTTVFSQQQSPSSNDAPPRSDAEEPAASPGESSSHDTRIDLSPPKDDSKNHPHDAAADTASDEAGDVHEMRSFNPYRAVKDNEVGDYYFKIKNYRAALARYQDALEFKENDAIANFRMAQCYEKLNQPDEAIVHFKEYLRILPHGPLSKDARKALAKLGEKQTAAIPNKQ